MQRPFCSQSPNRVGSGPFGPPTSGGGGGWGGGAFAGCLIGDVLLFCHSAEHRGGEVGYVLAPGFRGHGYAAEAVSALLGLAFDDLGLHRVVARLDPRNVASARLARRLGMRHEAHFVGSYWDGRPGREEWTDEDVYALRADERPTSPR